MIVIARFNQAKINYTNRLIKKPAEFSFFN